MAINEDTRSSDYASYGLFLVLSACTVLRLHSQPGLKTY